MNQCLFTGNVALYVYSSGTVVIFDSAVLVEDSIFENNIAVSNYVFYVTRKHPRISFAY